MTTSDSRTLTVLVYSDDATVRTAVRHALGARPAPELPRIALVECATPPMAIKHMDSGEIDVAILDGEAVPAGGLGLARQFKDEIYNCPPILVVTGRPQDAWLASWSRADAVVAHPIQARPLADAVAGLMRQRLTELPA